MLTVLQHNYLHIGLSCTQKFEFYDVLNRVQTIIYLTLKIVISELKPSLEARNAEKHFSSTY